MDLKCGKLSSPWLCLAPRAWFGIRLILKKIEQSNIWVNYNELTASSLEIIVSKGNHPQMALIQVSELL